MEYVGAALLGFAGGAVGGLLGVGGGILFVPALLLTINVPHLPLVGAWRQQRFGNVRVRDGLVFAALSPVGVLIGVQLSNAVPERALELGFAALMLFVAAQFLRRGLRSRPPESRARARP